MPHCWHFSISLLFIFANIICALENVIVFQRINQAGVKLTLSISNCTNIPESLEKRVSSIDTGGNCVRLFEEKECKGVSIEIMPHSPSHYDLTDWKFDNRARSVGPCRSLCDVAVTGENKESFQLSVFSRAGYEGLYENITVTGCTLLPRRFAGQVGSIRSTVTCVQLYPTSNCKSKYTSDNGWDYDSIELRDYTPKLDDIKAWSFSYTGSISHCRYKCNKSQNESFWETESIEEPTESGVVHLFSDINFHGHRKNLLVQQNCQNLRDLDCDGWEGAVGSIKLSNNTCLTLCNLQNCFGNCTNIISSVSDVAGTGLQGGVRSVKNCKFIAANTIEIKKFLTAENIVLISVGCIGILLLIIIVIICICLKRRNTTNALSDILLNREIDNFILGDQIDSVLEDESEPPASFEVQATSLPYNSDFEIPRNRIKVGENLGSGQFGMVCKGWILPSKSSQFKETRKVADLHAGEPVAIKTLNPNSTGVHLKSLMTEQKIFAYVGKHPHIVKMIGSCTKNLRKGELWILMEFCPNGSLEQFLRTYRTHFTTEIGKCDSQRGFNIYRLVRWCVEIARGMEYLSSRKVIHRDLAARNVLLGSELRAKIADFGLSRKAYDYIPYFKQTQDPVPVKWLAIESLMKPHIFTTKSDVWSFGVLCWEIFSLGEEPFSEGIEGYWKFVTEIRRGKRLSKPEHATDRIFSVMSNCWEPVSHSRPTFKELSIEFTKILDNLVMECMKYMDTPSDSESSVPTNKDHSSDDKYIKAPQVTSM